MGLLALQGEAYPQIAPYPLDVLGAESEGMRASDPVARHGSVESSMTMLAIVVHEPGGLSEP